MAPFLRKLASVSRPFRLLLTNKFPGNPLRVSLTSEGSNTELTV